MNLLKHLSLSKIERVVFSINLDKELGMDGFTTLFLLKARDVIGFYLLLAMKESRNNGSILSHFNATNIVLIPKVNHPLTFADSIQFPFVVPFTNYPLRKCI